LYTRYAGTDIKQRTMLCPESEKGLKPFLYISLSDLSLAVICSVVNREKRIVIRVNGEVIDLLVLFIMVLLEVSIIFRQLGQPALSSGRRLNGRAS
jgi:hypothetical protein